MMERMGKYHIVDLIGRGGMGAVYKAHDPLLKRPVAVKVISESVEVTDELRARFFREARACAQLNHPNIITIFEMGEDQGRLFIVMEYLEGEELRQMIARRRELPLEEKLALMTQVCDGLGYAHQKGIVHRDVKPGNVFVLRNGLVKILDFGVARIATSEGLTGTGLMVGTLRYMAPEQARGQGDYRSDMFSAGALFYELMTRRPLLAGEDALTILDQLQSSGPPSVFRADPSIPDDVAAVIERAVRRNPEERFRDMAEMRAALDAVRGRLDDEASVLRRRLVARAVEVRQLQSRVAEQVGGESRDLPQVPAERTSASTLEALWRQYETHHARLTGQLSQAEALRPRFEQALERVRQAQWGPAVDALEAIASEMPEHTKVQSALARAREELRRAEAAPRPREDTVSSERAPRTSADLRQSEPRAGAILSETAPAAPRPAAQPGRAEAVRHTETGGARRSPEPTPSPGEEDARQLEPAPRTDGAVRRLEPAVRSGDDSHQLEIAPTAREPEPPARRSEDVRPSNAAPSASGQGPHPNTALPLGQPPRATESAPAAREDAREPRAAVRASTPPLPADTAPAARDEIQRAVLEQTPEGQTQAPARPSALRQSPPTALETATRQAAPAERTVRSAPTSSARTVPETPAEGTAASLAEPTPSVDDDDEPGAIDRQTAAIEPGRLRSSLSPKLLLTVLTAIALTAVTYFVGAPILRSQRARAEFAAQQQRVAAARQEAVNADASTLAKQPFDTAAAKEREARDLAAAGRFPAALAALEEARERFESAARSARGGQQERGNADRARARMREQKQRAAPQTGAFADAVALENEAEARYRAFDFPKATTTFDAATQLFAKAMTPPPTPAPPPATPGPEPAPDYRAEIRELLQQYTRVFATKDLGLLQQIRPRISPDELSLYRQVFEQTRSYRLNLRVDAIKVTGDSAEARGKREDVVVTDSGDRLQTPSNFVFRLKRENGQWTIDAVK